MSAWTGNELNNIGNAEELEIASLKTDGTLGKPRTIWVVRVADELYVRSVNGRGSDWFRGVLTRHAGQIQAGGVTKDVTFVEVDTNDTINPQIDAAYRTKYRRYAANIIHSTLTAQAHSATLRLMSGAASAQ